MSKLNANAEVTARGKPRKNVGRAKSARREKPVIVATIKKLRKNEKFGLKRKQRNVNNAVRSRKWRMGAKRRRSANGVNMVAAAVVNVNKPKESARHARNVKTKSVKPTG